MMKIRDEDTYSVKQEPVTIKRIYGSTKGSQAEDDDGNDCLGKSQA